MSPPPPYDRYYDVVVCAWICSNNPTYPPRVQENNLAASWSIVPGIVGAMSISPATFVCGTDKNTSSELPAHLPCTSLQSHCIFHLSSLGHSKSTFKSPMSEGLHPFGHYCHARQTWSNDLRGCIVGMVFGPNFLVSSTLKRSLFLQQRVTSPCDAEATLFAMTEYLLDWWV